MSTRTTGSAEETREVGRAVGRALVAGDVVALIGDLGAGKTQFVKGMAAGLGAGEGVVTSPTFVLMNRYVEGRMPLAHYDLYRLESPDLEALGYLDAREEGAVVVEWADKAGHLLGERLEVRFDVTGADSRRLSFVAVGARGKTLHDRTFSDRSRW
jgi:tRNA threonylcarbamoyladenosine biosynthesis protein TsaE